MPICKVCLKEMTTPSFLSFFSKENIMCPECQNKFRPVFRKVSKLDGNIYVLYHYDETIRSLLYQFKVADDYEIYSVFLGRFAPYLRLKFHDYILVPAPSVSTDNERRGYNHVEMMFSVLKLPLVRAVKKINSNKQTNRTKRERYQIKDDLALEDNINLAGKKVLLIDDVLTTGSTLNTMEQLIKTLKPAKIEKLVLSIVASHPL